MKTGTVIEILIDSSGSMGYMKGTVDHENKYLINGQTRMSLVKEILINHIIPTIDYSQHVIIRTFRNNNKELSVPIIYQGDFELEQIFPKIKDLQDPPLGGTPITAAIDIAVSDLVKYPENDRIIILLTDGEENGGGDYLEAVKNIEKMQGIPCKLFLVGLAQDVSSEAKSRIIANGGYYNIKSENIDEKELQSVLTILKTDVLRNSIQNLQKSLNVQSKHQFADNQQKISDTNKILENNLIDSTTITIDTEYSEEIRLKSECFLYRYLCEQYGKQNIIWLNEKGESYSNHDFELLDEKGEIIKLIECKGTSYEKPTFYLTIEEWNCFLSNINMYQIYRIFNVSGEMKIYCIDNLYNYLFGGKVAPYLLKPEKLKEQRIYLTILS